jgi:transposase
LLTDSQESGVKNKQRPTTQLEVKTILNRIRHFVGFVYQSIRLRGSGSTLRLEVKLEAHRGIRGKCASCMQPAPGYDRLAERRWLFVPLWGILVHFFYAPRRVECPEHGVGVECIPWSRGKRPVTTAMMGFLARWAHRLSWRETARTFQTSWEAVYHSVAWFVEWGLAHRQLEAVRSLGVDEIHWDQGKHADQFLTVIYQIDRHCRRLLWVGRRRTQATLRRGLTALGPAVDQVHRAESTRLHGKPLAAKLKKMRWKLLRRGRRVRGQTRIKLHGLLASKLATGRAWDLKECFDYFWHYRSIYWAGGFLDYWTERAMRSRLEPMKKVARMLRKHEALLLNWFKAKGRVSSGVVEGLNNKIRVVTRRSYGFRTFNAMEIALFHNLGKLPAPESTHRFC